MFPAVDQLADTVDESVRGDLKALCRRQTHHGRDLTDRFCGLEKEAVSEAATAPHEIRVRFAGGRLPSFLPAG